MKVVSMYRDFHRTLFLVCVYLFYFGCNLPKINSICDSKSDEFYLSLAFRFITFDETPTCGSYLEVKAPSFLECSLTVPQKNGEPFLDTLITDGTRLSYVFDPPLPNGIASIGNTVQGTYRGWRANRITYSVTGSNPKGTKTCLYTPKWMGKIPNVTGLSSCFDQIGTADPTCSSPAKQDGDLKLGIPRSYVGPTLEIGGEITEDMTTNLTWTSCSRNSSGSTCTGGTLNTFTYSGAVTECTALNSLNGGIGFAGKQGWRVPEIEELNSTFQFIVFNPSIDQNFFPNTTAFNYKSITYANVGQTIQYYATFIDSTIGAGALTDTHYLRCVTGDPYPTTKRLIDTADGTILDLDTSLVWQKCAAGFTNVNDCTGAAAGTFNWTSSINYCNSLTLANRTWHLPNVQEFLSLSDPRLFSVGQTLDPIYFPNNIASAYHSSTTYLTNTNQNFAVNFDTYTLGPGPKNNLYPVRCVSSF